MDWSKSLYREEWNELLKLYTDKYNEPKWATTTELMKWMIKAVNKRIEQECNCENNSKLYCITKEY